MPEKINNTVLSRAKDQVKKLNVRLNIAEAALKKTEKKLVAKKKMVAKKKTMAKATKKNSH